MSEGSMACVSVCVGTDVVLGEVWVSASECLRSND